MTPFLGKILDFIILLCFLFLLILLGTGGFSFSVCQVMIQSHDTRNPTLVLILLLLFKIVLKPPKPAKEIEIFPFLTSLLPTITRRLKEKDDLIIIGLFAGVYILIMSLVTIMRHISYNSYAFDLGIFDQIIWNMVNGNDLHSSILGDRHFFGEHVSPILLIIGPLYLIYPHPITLIVFQTVALASGTIPVYLLAKKKLESSQLAILFSFMYLCYQPLRYVNLFDFHEIALSTPLLLFTFLYLEQRRYVIFGLFLTLAVFCKEEISVIVVMIGLYIVLVQKNKKLGMVLAFAGIMIFITEIAFIIPYYRKGPFAFVDRYIYLGENIPDILQTLVFHPIYVLKHVAVTQKLLFLIEVFGPVGFLSFLSPSHLLLTLPTLFQNLLSDFEPQYSIEYQYTAPLISFVFISAIYGLRNLLGHTTFREKLNISPNRTQVNFMVSAGLLLCCLLFFGNSPAYLLREYQVTSHTKIVDKLLERIPATAVVSAQGVLVPHLSHRKNIYEFPEVRNADYIVLDTTKVTWPISKIKYCQGLYELFQGTYGVIGLEDDVFLFKNRSPSLFSKNDILSQFSKKCQNKGY
jgi:uncharacterized membrane protein